MAPLWRRLPITIGQIDPELLEASEEELLGHLEGESVGLKVAAACVLALRGEARAFEPLVEGLGEKGLRYAALEALRHLGDPRAAEPVRRVFGRLFLGPFERTQAAGVLAGLGDEAGRAHLLARIGRRRFTEDRGLAIEIAADLRLEPARPALERLVDRPKEIFRGAALKALAAIDPEAARPRLETVLLDEREDSDVRADAAEALAEVGGPGTRKILEQAADSVHEEVAAVARRLLTE